MFAERCLRKILIVEDDLALRSIWEQFFKKLGDENCVDWAVSCEEALKMIEQTFESKENYSLIISDLFLAGSKTGMALISSPQVVLSKANTILISASDRDEIIENFGHLLPGTIIISKPISFKKFEIIFKNLIDQNLVEQKSAA